MAVSSKHPIQVYLDDRQNMALRRLAREEDITISELIRRGVDLLLETIPAEKDSAYQIIGLGRSGIADLGMHHDEYLAQEIEKESQA